MENGFALFPRNFPLKAIRPVGFSLLAYRYSKGLNGETRNHSRRRGRWAMRVEGGGMVKASRESFMSLLGMGAVGNRGRGSAVYSLLVFSDREVEIMSLTSLFRCARRASNPGSMLKAGRRKGLSAE